MNFSDVISSMEGIDFETTEYRSKLDYAIRSFRASKSNDTSKLEDTLRDLTGINFSITVHKHSYQAYIYTPTVSTDNPLTAWVVNWLRNQKDGKELTKGGRIAEGTLDLNKGRASGDYKDLEFRIGIGDLILANKDNFSVPEAAAIITHEVGHGFYYLVALSSIFETNEIVEEVMRGFRGTDSKKIKHKVLREATKNRVKIDDPDEVVNAESDEITRFVLVRSIVKEHESMIGDNPYLQRNFEALADQFAVRKGYGEALASGLKKFYEGDPGIGSPFGSSALWLDLLSLAVLLAAPGYGAGMVFGFALVGLLETTARDNTYDSPKKRIEVMRHQLNRYLADKDIPTKEKKAMLAQIDEMESLWKEANDNNIKGIWNYFWEVFPLTNRGFKKTNYQKDIESLANNRLSEAAARIEVS